MPLHQRTRLCAATKARARLAPDSCANRLQPERVERLRARRDEHALRLQVEIERLEAQLAAEARLLVAAERDAREGRVGSVDRHRARLDPARQAVSPGGIPRPDGREEAVFD